MRLVVSLLTYNSAEFLPECLKSVAAQTFRDFELVCRDNNSQDESVEIMKRIAPDARVVAERENRGFSAAHNATIRKSQSEYICILNPDLVLDPYYLEACIAFLDAHPRVGAVSGLLIRVRSLTERIGHDIIDSSGIVLKRSGRAINAHAGERAEFIKTPMRVLGVPATAAVYRREALDDVALTVDGRSEFFDTDFFMYKEDVDLALRLVLRGWEAWVLPGARAFHVRSTDPQLFVRPSPFINRLSYRNHWLFLLKSIPRSFWMRNGVWIIAFECAKFVYLLIREPRTLSALWDVWKLRKKMFAKRKSIMRTAKQTTFLRRPDRSGGIPQL